MADPELLREWHPLDHKPAPEYIPPCWIGPHVGVRLVEGFRVLQRLQMNGHPRAFGNGWPAYQREFTDLVQYADDEEWKADRRAEVRHSWAHVVPSSIEIELMERVIVWPARYLAGTPQLLRTVGVGVVMKARHRSLRAVARRLNTPGRLCRRWFHEGLDLIARGLIRDEVRVF
jgi:hypothetical protein